MAITATQRTDIVKVVVGLFNAAPGAIYLNKFTAYAGKTAGLTNDLVADPAFTSIYPSFLTSLEFGTKFVDALVGNAAAAADKQWAAEWIAGELNAGKTRAEVVTLAVTELQGAAGTAKWGAAATQFANKVAVAEYYSVNMLGSATDVGLLQGVVANVTATTDVSTPAALEAAVSATPAGTTGQTFMLTKGLDNVPGTSGNDTIIGSVDAGNAELNTLSALDIINGGAGTDTLKVATNAATAVPLANLSNVEIIEVQGAAAGGTTVDTTTLTGVTNLNITKTVGAINADAGATTDVSVALATAAATVVDGGKNVNVALADAVNGSTVAVGGALAAKGTVTVDVTGKASAANADVTLGTVAVTGGTTISVTQKATSNAAAAATDKVGTTITQGAVTVVGNASTTTVTVKQDASVAEVLAVDAVAAKATTKEVVFTEAKKGDTVKIDFGAGELTFTANKDLTAAEVASAFANLAKDAKQGNASASLGIYTDATGGVSDNWTSGAVQTVSATQSKVVFSSTTAAADLTAAVTGTVTATAQNLVAGTAAVAAKTGVLGVANGAVSVTDANGTIKTITVDGYANSTTTTTTVLETLNLSNSGLTYDGAGKVTGAASMTVADTAATLALNLEKVGFSGYYNGDATTTTQAAAVTLTAAPTTLNVKSTGNNYVNLTAAATETLNVSGTGLLNASTTDLAALKTVKVTETAGLSLNAAVNNTVESVDTTGTTGTVTVTINGDKATYTGGAGVDNVSVANAATAISKAIDLGAGDDRLDLSATLAIDPASTVELKGGDGTDTIVLRADAAVARTGGVTFQDRISGFERLEIGQLGAASTVNLDNLDDINYVISNGSALAAGPGFASNTKNDGAGAVPGPAVTENNVVVFNALTAGQSYSVAGRTVYATGAATAAEVAAAFISGASAGNLVVGGTLSGWTVGDNGAGSLADALFTSTTASTNVTDLSATSAGVPANLLTLDKMLTGATVELKAAGNVEVKLGTDGAADVVNFVTNAATNTVLGTATADKVETINIEAKDTDVTATATGTANVSTNFLVLDADAAKTVNLTGAGNLTLTLSADSKEVTLIDGSTATGKLNVTTLAGDTAATTVKGGSAADTLVAQGANDVLIGGAGNDVLKVVGNAASAVTLTGGDGVDQFDVSGFLAANAGAAVTITDLAKGETIKFAFDADANFASSKVTLIGEATFDNYVTEAIKAADAASAGDHGLAWFQFNNNTFIVQDVDGDAVFDNSGDIIVKLNGLVDLSASSFNEVGQGTLLYI